MILTLRFVIFAACLLAAGTALCGTVLPRIQASFTTRPPVIDGIINEKEWIKAYPARFPRDADSVAPGGTDSCEVRVLWAKEGLYVGFQTQETTPAFGHLPKGGPLWEEDTFEIFVDAIGDYRQYYEIQIDPAGNTFFKNYLLTAEPRLTAQGRLTPEFSTSEYWRYELPVPDGFKVASKLDPQTHLWTVEAFLPAAFVDRRRGGGPLKPGTWRVNFVRHDWDQPKEAAKRKVKFMYWASVLPGHPHLSPTKMGYLILEKP